MERSNDGTQVNISEINWQINRIVLLKSQIFSNIKIQNKKNLENLQFNFLITFFSHQKIYFIIYFIKMLKGLKKIRLRCLTEKSLAIFLHKPAALFSLNRIQLSKEVQKSVVAYLCIHYIQSFKDENFFCSSLSIRQRLISRQIFYDFMRKQIRKAGKDNTLELHDIGLQQQAISEVLNGFSLSAGAIYNSLVYNQFRVQDASTTKQINLNMDHKKLLDKNQTGNRLYQLHMSPKITKITTLNPTTFTRQIFKKLLDSHNIIISGEKGTGKSFAYLIYNYLSSFIFNVTTQTESNYSKQFSHYILLTLLSQQYQVRQGKKLNNLVKPSYFAIKKIIYIPIRQASMETCQKAIRLQINELSANQIAQIQKKIKNKTGKDMLSSLVNQVSLSYIMKGIILFFVIDQANVYFSVARKYFKNEQAKVFGLIKYEAIDVNQTYRQLELLIKYSEIITSIASNSQKCLFNSSQAIQPFALSNQLKEKNLYDFFTHRKDTSHNLDIGYLKSFQTPVGHIQLYGILFFEITASLMNKKLIQSQITNIRPIFQKTFHLNDKNLEQNLVKWQIDVRPLEIKQMLQKYDLQELKSAILCNQEEIIISQFKKIKKAAQSFYSAQLQPSILKCLSDATSDLDYKVRLAILVQVRLIAHKKLKNKEFIKNKQRSFNVSLAQIKNAISNQAHKDIGKMIQLIIPVLNIGYLSSNKLILTVTYDPKTIIQKTKVIYDQKKVFDIISAFYYQLIDITQQLLYLEQKGQILDKFVSYLFKRGNFSIGMILINNQNYHQLSKTTAQIKTFVSIKGLSFPSWNRHFYLQPSFSLLFEEAKNQKNKLLGHQFITGSPNSKKNEGFDTILINSSQDTINVTTIDFTVSDIKTKLNKKTTNLRKIKFYSRAKFTKLFFDLKPSKNNIQAIQYFLDKNGDFGKKQIPKKFLKSFAFRLNQQFPSLPSSQFEQLLINSKFTTVNSLKLFMKEIMENPPNWKEFPEKLLGENYPQSKHHFYVQYQHMLWCNQPYNLNWNHIIAVPSNRLKQYQQQILKRDGQFIFQPIVWIQNDKQMSLKFSIGSFDLKNVIIDEQSSAILQEESVMKAKSFLEFTKKAFNKKYDYQQQTNEQLNKEIDEDQEEDEI